MSEQAERPLVEIMTGGYRIQVIASDAESGDDAEQARRVAATMRVQLDRIAQIVDGPGAVADPVEALRLISKVIGSGSNDRG